MKATLTIAGCDITLDAGYTYVATRPFLLSGNNSVAIYIVCLNPETSRGSIMVKSIEGVPLVDADRLVMEFNKEIIGTMGRHWG